jgi:protein-L-isoaspartate(D-aspartate) O-methyltransferase
MHRNSVPHSFITETVAPACGNDKRIIEAFLKTPRAKFIDEAMCRRPYADDALPIGFGQTISKPSTVALMTKTLRVEKHHKVLEIGSGSGFQAAILSRLCNKVYTVERIPELYRRAMGIVQKLLITNIRFKLDDGNLGWSENGPYDRIIATAEARHLPEELLAQLADDGIMLIPLGGSITEIIKENGEIRSKKIADCSFVDFVCGK